MVGVYGTHYSGDGVRAADISIRRVDGTWDYESAASDAARGTLLLALAAAANPGDWLHLSAGKTFALGTSPLELPDYVSMSGEGMYSTTITTAAILGTHGCGVVPGTGSTIADLAITSTLSPPDMSVPLGINTTKNARDTLITHALGQRLRLVGPSDAAYWKPGDASHMTLRDCILDSNWDGLNAINGTLELHGCHVTATGPHSTNPACAVRASGGRLLMYGGTATASGGANQNLAFKGSSALLVGVTMSSSGNNPLDFYLEAPGIAFGQFGDVRAIGCVYDPTKVDGGTLAEFSTFNSLAIGPQAAVRTVTADPLDATPADRPWGTLGEIVAYGTPTNLFRCTINALPGAVTWEQLTANA